MNVLGTFDFIIFFGSLVAIMAIGLWAGRKEETSEDFYLAGKQARWWGVAGSIFGSNVSANHIVGMMGVGFAFGFAQSHFEITAIVGLLMLCYVFLPVYRKLNVFTLSEYLSRRYNDASRLAYAMIMVAIMIVIQMVPGFYIGSRAVNILIQGDTGKKAIATAEVGGDGVVTALKLASGGRAYADSPKVLIDLPAGVRDENSTQRATASVTMSDGVVTGIALTGGGAGYKKDKPPAVRFRGGSSVDATVAPGDVDPQWYVMGIILMAIVTGTYTIIGGLKAVIVTDVIQSVLLLIAGLLVAYVTFSQPEVGGWANMVAMDSAEDGADKLHLYFASDHPGLPWTGVLTGLMVLHFYYWGTNQFIVQRALAAKSDREARMGIISAGFFKLLIPFFSIGTGIAAYYLFKAREMEVAQDVVFIKLLTELIAPLGFGLVGLVAAGMIGAILSSLDSMMNSAATIFTFDVYKRYINPEASEKKLVFIGRVCIVVSIALAAFLTIVIMGANSEGSFFLYVAAHQGRLIAGVVVAFVIGMLWRRASALGAFVSIVVGVALSYGLQPLYANFVDGYASMQDGVKVYDGFGKTLVDTFGANLNFFHAVFVAAIVCAILHVGISLMVKPNEEKGKLTWIGLGVFTQTGFTIGVVMLAVSLALFGILGAMIVPWGDAESGMLKPVVAAWIAAVWTFAWFMVAAVRGIMADEKREMSFGTLLVEDRAWAGLLGACAIFMMYYFY